MAYPVIKNTENVGSKDISERSPYVKDQQEQNNHNSIFNNIDTGLKSRVQSKTTNNWPKVSNASYIEQNKAKVKSTELILFTTQLSVMLDSGVVLSDALDAIAEQAENGTLKSIISVISNRIKSGENFSKALTGYPKV